MRRYVYQSKRKQSILYNAGIADGIVSSVYWLAGPRQCTYDTEKPGKYLGVIPAIP